MTTFLAGLATGLIIGANVGYVLFSILYSGIDTDDPRAQKCEGADEQEPHGEVVIVHRR